MTTTYVLPDDRISRGCVLFTNERPRLRTVTFQNLPPISIEIEIGQTKSGIDENGNRWEHTYTVPYGEIPSTRSLADGDGVDIYLGIDPSAAMIYVIHQNKMDGSFDEDKVMIGFSSSGEAIAAYKAHGPSWGFGSMDTMSVDQFVRGYLASNRKL